VQLDKRRVEKVFTEIIQHAVLRVLSMRNIDDDDDDSDDEDCANY